MLNISSPALVALSLLQLKSTLNKCSALISAFTHQTKNIGLMNVFSRYPSLGRMLYATCVNYLTEQKMTTPKCERRNCSAC